MTSPAEMLGRTLLGRYRIVMPIGQGGMGTVYLARTEGAAGFAKPVVIKQILPALVADGGMVQLFIREARLLSNLHHPGIVNVLDFGEESGAYVMVLEYVHGYNLAEWAKYALTVRGALPVEFLVHIVSRVLDTLHYAHTYRRPDGKSLAIIHRDVSPGNVLLDTEGHVKLGDFGIARASDDPGEYRSRVGSFKGKLAYSAPELIAGEEATPRSDVYAAGVVLLHLLLGSNPFRGNTMAESVQRVLNLAPPKVSAMRADALPELDEVIGRALMKSPKQRWKDAAEFADALRAIRGQSDEHVANALAKQLHTDFNAEMAAMLDLEPLARRDAAWRSADDDLEHSLRSTVPPPKAPPLAEQTTLAETPPQEAETVRPRVVGSSIKTRWLVLAFGGVLLAAGAVAAVVLVPRGQPESAPQFVVIDRRAADDPSPARNVAEPVAMATATATSATTHVAPNPDHAPASASTSRAPASPPVDVATSAAPKPAEPDSAALSRAVQRQGGSIQRCFERHVEAIGGSPQVSIRFSIDAAGNVTSAQVSPASVAGTPLGGCLLGVAKSTSFPPQGRPVTFTIPITARVSK